MARLALENRRTAATLGRKPARLALENATLENKRFLRARRAEDSPRRQRDLLRDDGLTVTTISETMAILVQPEVCSGQRCCMRSRMIRHVHMGD